MTGVQTCALPISVDDATNEKPLLPPERTADFKLVAGANRAVRLRHLSIDFDLAVLARLLRFGARSEETGDVEPDVQSYRFHRDIFTTKDTEDTKVT